DCAETPGRGIDRATCGQTSISELAGNRLHDETGGADADPLLRMGKSRAGSDGGVDTGCERGAVMVAAAAVKSAGTGTSAGIRMAALRRTMGAKPESQLSKSRTLERDTST